MLVAHRKKKHSLTGRSLGFVTLTLFILGLVLTTTSLHAEESSPPREWIGGSLDLGLDAYRTDRDSDLKLDQVLHLHISPPEHDQFRINTGLWLREDLDGKENSTSTLRGLDDAYDSSVRANVLYLNVEAEDLWGDSTLRIGRQRILEGLAYNRIDGAYFRQSVARWDWYAFAGARASFYENGHDDYSLGGGFVFRTAPTTRIALDTFYANEERGRKETAYRLPLLIQLPKYLLESDSRHFSDTVIGISAWHDVNSALRLYGRYLWKDGNGDELRLNAHGYSERTDVSYEVALRTQLTSSGDSVSDIPNFFRVLGEYEPYYNLFVNVSHPFTPRTYMTFELELHNAENDDPQSANRDYERFAAIMNVEDIRPGLDASVVLEYWGVQNGEGSWVATGELSRTWESFRLRAGIDFSRYDDRFIEFNPWPQRISALRVALNPSIFYGFTPLVRLLDTTLVTTHENIYATYLALDWTVSENKDMRFRVDWEQDDGPDSPYWGFDVSYTLRF